jgi:hypothetical protein
LTFESASGEVMRETPPPLARSNPNNGNHIQKAGEIELQPCRSEPPAGRN